MNELTTDQVAELKQKLLSLRDELKELLSATRDGTRPVDLDEPIGRLTRMDAIQQQSMSAAARRSHNIRLAQVEQALTAIARDTYGLCRRCEDPIGHKRLEARPESPYCLDCQDEVDRKHGGG
ncbi:MAG: TraR/DksA family transcriptional regulator [bacterium]|nr:TraR/DksA family transcriptional regulator [bacterium]